MSQFLSVLATLVLSTASFAQSGPSNNWAPFLGKFKAVSGSCLKQNSGITLYVKQTSANSVQLMEYYSDGSPSLLNVKIGSIREKAEGSIDPTAFQQTTGSITGKTLFSTTNYFVGATQTDSHWTRIQATSTGLKLERKEWASLNDAATLDCVYERLK